MRPCSHPRLLPRALLLALVCLSLPVPSAHGQSPTPIRIWGHGHRGQDYIATLLNAWEHDFQKTHPGQSFSNSLLGNASALAGLSTGAADLALIDRQASFIEADGYDQVTGHAPFGIAVARGSVATPHHAPAPILYVNRANPLDHLTLAQLDGIFDADHRRGDRAYTTWGSLGLSGDWAAHPIQLYGYNIVSNQAQFFERAALKGSQKWSCCLKLFAATPAASAESQINAALAKDKYGLALSAGPAPAPGLKALALSATDAGPFVKATPESLTSGAYPLARTIYLYVDRKPKSALSPPLAAFLNYIVSPAGQAVAARTGGYLPLSEPDAAQATESLR